jgi:hypothetical protein
MTSHTGLSLGLGLLPVFSLLGSQTHTHTRLQVVRDLAPNHGILCITNYTRTIIS